jgi:hypothetical protein
MPVKPDLTLGAEITTADGTRFQWGKGSNVPGDVPQALSFRTKLGDGFSDASVTLSRRIDVDYPDINLFDNVVFYGGDGSTAYEGRVGANPRSIGDTSHSMSVVIAGWMAHTRDRMFQQVYVDRDGSHWVTPPLARRTLDPQGTSAIDYTAESSAGGLTFSGASAQQIADNSGAELMYLMPLGSTISSIEYVGTNANTTSTEAPSLFTSANADMSGAVSNGLTLDNALHASSVASPVRFGMLRARANATHTPAAGSGLSVIYSKIAVYGLAPGVRGIVTAGGPDGVSASDVIRHIIANYCPLLNTNGVQETTYAISHLAFIDRIDPFDAIAEVNKYHRWQFGVWENRTFTYGPTDLTDYDWSVDLFEPGVTLDVQGDSTDDGAFNGICVTFTDLQTGNQSTLTPDTNPELADTDPENPANRAGIKHWDEIPLSSPALSADAIQIASAALVERNTPKGQGSITVVGHLKDRAGHWQQGWKVRAGDRVAITSSTSLSDRPRLISETSWDQDSHTLTITVEDTAQRVDAFLDRLNTSLSAAGLG